MKREDQRRNREIKSNLNLIMKECTKVYKNQNLKKRDYMLWVIRNSMIYTFFPSTYIRESDLKPILEIWMDYKPLWADDLVWEILKAEANKQEPDSLRAVGAFTALSAEYKRYDIELQSEDIDSIRSALYEKIDEFFAVIDELDENLYVDQIINLNPAFDVDKAVVYIHLEKFEEAKAILMASDDSGRFGVGNKTYRELAIKYLKKKEKEKEKESSDGCYIATAVYGSYECPEVWTLRRFRDYDLAATWYGRLFIQFYYAISPTLVRWFGNTRWFKRMWKGKLDRMVERLQERGYESTPYSEKE